jgi:hypothetical protein
MYILLLCDGWNVLHMSSKSIWCVVLFKFITSSLIFSWCDLYNVKSEVLKSPTIIMLFIYPFSLLVLPYIFSCPDVMCRHIHIYRHGCCIFLMNWAFYAYIIKYANTIFVWYRYSYFIFICLPFAWSILFDPLILI